MKGFINKLLITSKSALLPYVIKNWVLIAMYAVLTVLLIDTNIRLRHLENGAFSSHYGLAINDIVDKVDTIENMIDTPLTENDVTGEINNIREDISNLESQLNDIQEKVDDLWFKLY